MPVPVSGTGIRIVGQRVDGESQQHLGEWLATWAELRVAAERAVAAGTDPAGSGWDLAGLLLHVAAWWREGTARVPALLGGAPSVDYDVDAFNEAATARATTAEAALADLVQAAGLYTMLLAGLRDRDYDVGDGSVRAWAEAAGVRHPRLHLRDLSATSGSKG